MAFSEGTSSFPAFSVREIMGSPAWICVSRAGGEEGGPISKFYTLLSLSLGSDNESDEEGLGRKVLTAQVNGDKVAPNAEMPASSPVTQICFQAVVHETCPTWVHN